MITFVRIAELEAFIFEDLRNRGDYALSWLYQEYANYQGYNVSVPIQDKRSMNRYDDCLTRLLNGLLERPDQKEGYVYLLFYLLAVC